MSAWGYMGYKARSAAVKDGFARGDDAPALAAIFGTTVDEILRIAELKGLIKVSAARKEDGEGAESPTIRASAAAPSIPQERSGTAREAPSTLEGRDAVPVAASVVGAQPAAPSNPEAKASKAEPEPDAIVPRDGDVSRPNQPAVAGPVARPARRATDGILLDELVDASCRYPFGDRAPFRFCGARRHNNLPYCEKHARACYQPKRPENAA